MIIVRAEVEVAGGTPAVSSHTISSMMGSGLAAHLTEASIEGNLPTLPDNSDYSNEGMSGRLIGVEVFYDHEPLLGSFPLISDLFPDPTRLHTYSVMHVVR